MSIISNPSTTTTAAAGQREPSEYDGMWINVGVNVQDPENPEQTQFIRLSRGIAIGDLKPKKIYPNMSPEFAAQVKIENRMLMEIQQKALTLEEGESVSSDALAVQVYRRNEEIDQDTISSEDEAESLNLF